MSDRPKVRLYIEGEIAEGREVSLLASQSHYLTSVMRMGEGEHVEVFNGQSDAFAAEITKAHRKATVLMVGSVTARFRPASDIWLLFAPIKKARTDFIVEKATELGVARIQPVFTEYTNAERMRLDRLRAHAIEAAEQCGGTSIPDLLEPKKLSAVLNEWPGDRHFLFADEATAGDGATEIPQGPAAVLIGPEGGFSASERSQIHANPKAKILHLGPRILRADTAVVAALTRWQSEAGDWCP